MEEEIKLEENTVADLTLSQHAREFLGEAAKWGRFLSILTFISLGLTIFSSIFMGPLMNILVRNTYPTSEEVSSIVISFFYFCFYLLISLFYFFPTYYLFKFSKHTRKALNALNSGDDLELTRAFQFLKSHFKYIGISTVILFSLSVFIGIGFIVMVMAVGAISQ